MYPICIPSPGLLARRIAAFAAMIFAMFGVVLICSGSAMAQIRITEILVDPSGPNDGNQLIELTNLGGGTVDISGYYICQNFKYLKFPVGASLDPGETYIIHHRAVGTNDANNWYTANTSNSLTELVVAQESYAIYSSAAFASSAAIVSYVGWGAGGQDRENVAVGAGIWSAGDFAPVAPEGKSIQLCNPTGYAGSDWFVADPTIGGDNDCTPPPPQLVLNEILVHPVGGDSAFQLVEIQNRDSSPVDLLDWQLCYQSLNWGLPSLVLNPGAAVVVHVNAVGVDTATDLYTGDLGANLSGVDALALYKPINVLADLDDPDFIIDFAQWGGTGLPRATVAALAGIWMAGDSLDAPALGHSLERCAAAPGVGSWSETPDLTFGADNSCNALNTPLGTPHVTFVGTPFPNPFSDCTFVDFNLTAPARVVARVRDVRGRVLRVIADRWFPAGSQTIGWEGVDRRAVSLGPGVYFLEIWSPEALGDNEQPLHTVRRVVKLRP